MKLTPNKQRALQGLLTQPNKTKAAEAAGITTRTLQTYLADPDFQQAYAEAFRNLVESATRQAQQALSPAISALRSIVEDEEETSNARIAAAKALLEYGLRFTEFNDILQELQSVEGV